MGGSGDQVPIHRTRIGEMEHRGRVQIDWIVDPSPFASRIARIAHQVAVAKHHALGSPGRAARVEDAGEVRFGGARILYGFCRGDQRVVVQGSRRQRSGRWIIGIDERQAVNSVGKLDTHFGKRQIDDKQLGPAIS